MHIVGSSRRRTLVAVGVAVLLVACTATEDKPPFSFDATATADAVDVDVDAGAGVCCVPDPHPGCCMKYGGWSEGRPCLVVCDGMPGPSDPAWKLDADSHGCARWTNPKDYFNGGKFDGLTDYCGGPSPLPPPTADLDGAAPTSGASDAASES